MEGLSQIVVLGGFFAVMYFILIRPQRKRQQEQEQLLQALAVGDDVVTIGGLHGTIETLDDTTVDLLVTDDVVLRFQRTSIARIVGDEPLDDVDDEALADEEDA